MRHMANNWEILELYREQIPSTILPSQTIIQRFNVNQIDYNEFYWNYLKRNWPLILTDVANNWDCQQNWLYKNDNQLATVSAINFNYLKQKIGNRPVPIAKCNRRLEYFNSHAKCQMDFYNFLSYWKAKINQCDQLNGNKTEENFDCLEGKVDVADDDDTVLYLKDWHLKAQMLDYQFYEVPKYFASDWLNEHLIAAEQDDYRFVYMGPKNSWTPFHADVFGSYSWSTNIIGCKKWLLLPPQEELKLKDQLNNLPCYISEATLGEHNVQYFTIYQMPNEALFVPSGWYHQVWNTTDTISINHNWFNACNIMRIWLNLSKAMEQVINEIQDCRQMDNFDEHCQIMLRATFGLNYLDFIQLLETIVTHRLHYYRNNANNHSHNANKSIISTSTNTTAGNTMSSKFLIFFDQYIPNNYHVYHDLKAIKQVIALMLKDPIIFKNDKFFYKCLHLHEKNAIE